MTQNDGEEVLKRVLKGLKEGSPEYRKASREHHAKVKKTIAEQRKREQKRRRDDGDVIDTGMFG